MGRSKTPRAHLQIERHGITVAFPSVPVEKLADLLDRVLRDLAILEHMHDLKPPPEVVQIGGYHPVDVPDDDGEVEESGPVIGFR